MPSKSFQLGDYVDVAERLVWFFEKYPEGSLQSEVLNHTGELIVVKAYAYRSPDDPRPGTGLAAEVVPGRTPYTRDSEMQNAETSAWGRALAAIGSPTKGHIATRQDVENRSAPLEDPATCPHPPASQVTTTPSGRTLKPGEFYCERCGVVVRG